MPKEAGTGRMVTPMHLTVHCDGSASQRCNLVMPTHAPSRVDFMRLVSRIENGFFIGVASA